MNIFKIIDNQLVINRSRMNQNKRIKCPGNQCFMVSVKKFRIPETKQCDKHIKIHHNKCRTLQQNWRY